MIVGSCLCGAVKLQIDEPLEQAPEACHCAQCRKHTFVADKGGYYEILDDAPQRPGH